MKDHKDKELEKLVDKLMQHETLKTPSQDFTDNVIRHIKILEDKKATAYKPLIPKPIWALLAACFVGIFLFLVFGTPSQESTWMPAMNTDVLYDNQLTKALSGVKFSSITMYAFVFFALMLGIQIPLLKRYYEKGL